MVTKLGNCETDYKIAANRQQVIDALKMIKNEIQKELKVPGNEKLICGGLDELTIETFSPTVSAQVGTFLNNTLKTVYLNNFKRANELKDKLISS